MNMDYSAWEGWVIDGKVDTVLSRGTVVIENDAYVGRKGHGRFVHRGLSPVPRLRPPGPVVINEVTLPTGRSPVAT